MDSIAVTAPTLADSVQYWTTLAMKEQAHFFKNASDWLDFAMPALFIYIPAGIALVYVTHEIIKYLIKKHKK